MDVELDRPGDRIEMEKERQKQLHQLKKKNYELSNITRKLEEKVKNLEKKTKESPSPDRHSIFLMKQREKEAEYERQINERDVEIDKLKQRMKDLVRKLTGKNGEDIDLLNYSSSKHSGIGAHNSHRYERETPTGATFGHFERGKQIKVRLQLLSRDGTDSIQKRLFLMLM
ncbi:hypothetical protein Anas_02130 [Armadillidium nasatum]|uniref:Uncharacterized protein n=1 Tax=Armadillidium nasatum TaxID=96803 RepID=A0A5N5SN40_9CRUS|nr:hypothetical protein Anas_02130 [Armadillidium nasatum]